MLHILLITILRACEGNTPARRKTSRKSIIPRERKTLMKRWATLNQRIHKATNVRQRSLIQAKVCDIEKKIKDSYKDTGHQQITPSHAVKCLGVKTSDDATFQHHISETVNKAKRMVGWVLHTFKSREKDVMLGLWKALIQPMLDYCSQLCSPHIKGDIQKLESVQRAYTRKIRGINELNY
ncbi:hypothetical protein E2C01_036910 [Portunus trituberculatus]|uniref:Uncharacterized protein n=1 Tax=Portunus trituberculatus TaxID=210409 RepID=A0A5B7FD77_PORTR|nr:hypothetical protein [Portunus trituberculatus]